MAVLHGDNMFGKTPQALFLDWMKAFFRESGDEFDADFPHFQ